MHRVVVIRTAALLAMLVLVVPVRAFENLRDADLHRIGERIFANECGGRAEALLTWNAGEDFLSLGIGHFIWYPAGRRGPYEESFVDLVDFLQQRGVALPPLVRGDPVPSCPWPNRGAFLAAAESKNTKALRSLLQRTVAHQTRFMARRLRAALPRILDAVPASRRSHVERQYRRVARTPAGIYALVDYVNFKGEGVAVSERIAGRGWGLSQVLDRMDPLGGAVNPLAEFSRAAEAVLIRRAEADPRPVVRDRWLAGWLARVRGYAAPD